MKHLLIFFLLALPLHAVTFEAWVAGYSLTGGNSAETADPDEDGMSNLMEYALDGGVPNVHGPMSILPTFGWCMPLADGSFSLPTSVQIVGSPLGYHMCLSYKLRAAIEDVTATAQFSQPCPASNTDYSLVKWVDGQAIVRVVTGASGKLQAVLLFRADLVPRGFARLKITRGAEQTMPPVIGAAQPTLQLDLEPIHTNLRTVGTVTNSSITDRDVTYAQTSSPTIVTDFHWPWAVWNSGYTEGQVTRQSSAPGIITPTSGDKDSWTFVAPGAATLRLITPARTYEQPVTTISRSTVIERSVSSTVSTSLRRHLESGVNDRIAAFTAFADRFEMFGGYSPGSSYTRNGNCWLSSVDLTPLAAWNSAGVKQRGPTLISPRHILGAAHWPFAVGTTVHFVTAANAVVSRTVSAVSVISGTDIILGVLNSDVSAGIDFARVLPANWATKLPTLSLFGVPVCSSDQAKWVYCRRLIALNTQVVCAAPEVTSGQIGFYKDGISGDSGSPCFMVVNSKMVLLCAWLSGGGGGGPSITNYRSDINTAMTALGGGYQLTDVNLSAYTSY